MHELIKALIPVGIKIRTKQLLSAIQMRHKIREGKKIGINFASPNYLFKGSWDKSSTIVDVGCGFDADFSVYMIQRFGVHSIGIDPTRRHQKDLGNIVKKFAGLFRHEAVAVSTTDGKLVFNESENNISGSLLLEHKNVQQDTIKTYEVRSVGLKNLPEFLGLQKIKYIKLDLEGAEYDLIRDLKKDDVEKYEQIFVEFHHHCVPMYSPKDTLDRAEKMRSLGFNIFTLDNHNFLFWRPTIKKQKPRVIFEQYVIPHYRIPFFEELSKRVDLLVVASDDRSVDGLHDEKINLPFKTVRTREGKNSEFFHPEILNIIKDHHADVYISLSTALNTVLLDNHACVILKEGDVKTIWMGCDGYRSRNFFLTLLYGLLNPHLIRKTVREILFMRKIDRFVTYSSHTAKYLHAARFVPTQKIDTVHNAIDTSILNEVYKNRTKLGIVQEKNRIAFTGRLTAGKAVSVLIKAFAVIADEFPNARLEIIGEGSERVPLENLVKELGVKNLIEFSGPIYDDTELAKHLCRASLFVMPGLGGLGFNTAMACGLPIIYTNADGTEDDILIDGKNGFFFDGTPEDLSEKIRIALKNPDTLLAMGTVSENLITTQFNIENMANGYEKAIIQTLANE